MTQKIGKKFIIVMSVFIAVVLLSFWLIVSGTAESVIHSTAVKISSWWYALQHPYVEPELLDDLKPGKYLLQRDWGLDETDYIEVFDDYTVQFVSEYYEIEDEKNKAKEEEEKIFLGPYFSERNDYKMDEVLQFVQLAGTSIGFSYVDENTLEATRTRDEIDDVTDFNHEPNDPDTPRYHNGYVIAHYIYTEQ